MKKIVIASIVFVVCAAALYYGLSQQVFAPTASTIPTQTISEPEEIHVLAENLDVPWELRRLPDGDFLVTERTGTLARITPAGEVTRLEVPAIATGGEGGLLGLALHPDFTDNRWVYVYRTAATADGRVNQVVRYQYHDEHTLSDETILLEAIPGARYHDGGRLEFGPDGYLYITTGDAGETALAQDTSSLAGKILRMTDTGAIPEGNPYQNYVYSSGHRNPQGLAWDSAGRLWSTEHGRSGLASGMDELNLIEPGSNYGWPIIEGDETTAGMMPPVLHSGADETWAPASLAIMSNTAYFAGLRGESLYQAMIQADGTATELRAVLRGEYGRLRTVRVYDDHLYLLTSNTDGRGQASDRDDVVLQVPRALLTR